jgi:ABC-type polysaccharide/polyol phosphate transport system ATPase subunit
LDELIQQGSAVVLVSHDMNAIKKLATKALWLENGVVKMSGPVEQVVTAYENQ